MRVGASLGTFSIVTAFVNASVAVAAASLLMVQLRAMSICGEVVAGVVLPQAVLAVLDEPWGDSLNNALSKVGLILASRKSALEVIVIDSIDKRPTEN